jgi:hypothetical protein
LEAVDVTGAPEVADAVDVAGAPEVADSVDVAAVRGSRCSSGNGKVEKVTGGLVVLDVFIIVLDVHHV